MAEYAIIPYADYVAACDAVREKTDITGKIVSKDLGPAILTIETGGDFSEVNLILDEINGEVVGAKTVTFMANGKIYATVEVAPGDTASRPKNPTKASTVSEVFAFSGWSLEDDGTADSDALKNVTEDRTVYAVFTASPRPYTVSFYDDDGAFLKSEQVLYGGSASAYTPEKKGALFQNWSPEPINITGDLDCYAVWHYVAFTNDDWASIKAVAQTHSAADHYAKGDTRELTLNYADGTTETALLEVADLTGGHTLVDDTGSVIGTSGMTIRLKTALATPQPFLTADWVAGEEVSYLASPIFTYLRDTVIPAMPAELQAVLSAARQEYDVSTGKTYSTETKVGEAKLWLLTESAARGMSTESRNKTVYGTDTTVSWWLRDLGDYSSFPYSVLHIENGDSYLNTSLNTEEGAKSPMHIVFEFYL